MRLSVLSAIAALLLAGPAMAQQDPAAMAARVEAQKAAMAPLSLLDGQWRGTGWIRDRSGATTHIIQTERIGSMLGGSVKVIEGRGTEDGALAFNAFAVVSYNPDKKTYSMRSYANGQEVDVAFEARPDGFVWSMPAGPGGTIRYTTVIKDGAWTEIGEYVPTGGKGIQFMQMDLKRIGDTAWPSEGFVPPK